MIIELSDTVTVFKADSFKGLKEDFHDIKRDKKYLPSLAVSRVEPL